MKLEYWLCGVVVAGAFGCGCGDDAATANGGDTTSATDPGASDVETGSETGSEAGPDTTPAPSAAALGPNDVSVLLPAPKALADLAAYLGPTDAGAHGALFPKALFDAIGYRLNLALGEIADGGWSLLRVLAMRVDPCFQRAVGGACEAQVRLVLQPTDPTTGGPLDAAIHVFFHQSESDVTAIVRELVSLHALAPDALAATTLGPSPALTQGLTGAYGAALKTFILAHCGADKIVRFTFMARTNSRSGQWQFGGFDVSAGVTTPIAIAHTADLHLQTITRTFGAAGAPTYQNDAPLPAADPDRSIEDLFDGTSAAGTARTTALEALFRLENPALRVPDETSCVGCHVASFIDIWATRTYPDEVANVPTRFTRPIAITRTHDQDTNGDIVRAFGWFDQTPAVSERVTNETAAVLATLRSQYP